MELKSQLPKKSENNLLMQQEVAIVNEQISEQEVWDRFLNGDENSLIILYRKYVDVLFNYGCQMGVGSDYVRDCIQEVFCYLIDKRSSLKSVSSIKGYLFVCLKRRIMRGIKLQERRRIREEGFQISLGESYFSINLNLNEKDFSIIQRKVNQLPVNQREAILLHFFEGLTYSEIAEIMGIKIRSARALTYRALDSLEKHLNAYKGELV